MSEQTSYNTQPAGLEKWLDETYKKGPQLPDGGKKWLGDNAWWLALIGGILSLWGAWGFWNASQYVSTIGRWADDISRVTGVDYGTSSLGFAWYVALAAMVLQGVLLLMAFQKLKVHQKSGWNLLFYSSLVSLVMGVVYIMVPGYGAGSLIGTAIGAVIGWFFLFQARGKFVK